MDRPTRRDFLRLAAGGLAAGALRQTRAMAQDRKRNVLFIAIDDLRPQLACYGHAQMHSPGIDRLAAAGLLFERAYCQQAVCAPSRASLLSGLRPDSTHVYNLETPLRTVRPDVVTLPQHFKAHGYETISLGKIYHHGKRDDPQGWSRDPWRPSGEWKGRGYLDPASIQAVEQLQEKMGKDSGGRGPAFEAPDVPDEAYADGMLADEGIRLLSVLRDQPFFLAVGFYKPHLPFNAPKRYWDLYEREVVDLADNPLAPENCPPLALHNWGELRSYVGIPTEGRLDDDLARTLVHGYYACTSYTDAQIGRLLDALDRLGLADNTVVVLWGDHGWQLGEHGLWCKHSNFETSVHSPMILRAPDQPNAGAKTPALSEFVDIYPSLCELSGLPLPDHLEGTSVVPLIHDPRRDWKSAAFSQYPRGQRMGYSMRTDRHRFTSWQEKDGTVFARELYDHQADPAENVNIADLPEHEALVAELAKQLESGWRAARPA